MKLKLKVGSYVYLAVLGIAAAVAPAGQFVANAQTTNDGSSGTATVTLDNNQNASTVQNAGLNAMKWIGNIAMPIAGTGFGIHSIVQWRAGGRPIPSIATSAGCFATGGVLTLVQHWIQNSGSATGLQ
jgi:hypothetical protein